MCDILQAAELEEYAANMQIFPRSQFFVLSQQPYLKNHSQSIFAWWVGNLWQGQLCSP